MRTVLASISLAALSMWFSGSAGAAGQAPAPPASSAPSDAAKANDFNLAMYGALRAEKGNVFFSGTSMREALGIAYLGAHGETAAQMASALRLDADPAKSADLAKSEIADFKAARGTANLTIANRLWVDRTFTPKSAFSSSAFYAYGSPLDPTDFLHQPEPSRKTINTWVEKQTNDKIKDLLPPSSITPDTRLVITNAIWFKGDWERTFDKKATRDDVFLADGTTSSTVPMMHQTSTFRISSTDGAKMLEMKYGRSDLAMDVLLPDSNLGLSALENKIVAGGIDKWTTSLRSREVEVSFPKLTFTWGGSIKKPLIRLGMTTAFDDRRADLTGIADPAAAGGNLFVSDVFHKAFVAIDEQGTEAAAATGEAVSGGASAVTPPAPIPFKADHPFIVVIRDTKQNRILFMGRVTNPKG